MSYKRTVISCFTGYIIQAVVNNFLPLLFITLQGAYGIPTEKITLLITVNFGVQLTVDLLSVFIIDRIGYRAGMILAHVFSAAGFVLLPFLPQMTDPFSGILISVIVYAIGGGLLEVLVSPVMESCPTDNKETAMSMLHSFYCWGQVGVVLLSTLFFAVFGTERWRVLSVIWAILPLANGISFMTAPIAPLIPEGEKGMTVRELFSNKAFLILSAMMICSGACELTVSQWASYFAERGLGISKSAGDLAGPMAFAVLMGSARAFYGKFGEKLDLDRFMRYSALLCIVSYLMISLAPLPAVSLAGCALCGLSVGIMWPGTFSRASAALRRGGTAMFSLLALFGDVGCAGGPTLAGMLGSGDMRTGILTAAVFPVIMFILCIHRSDNTDF
ncbi:MAG: MFS transporter [Oscillospiraceae bacterium]|nr:MFS transporter [Oscillospiraceae bacterium]